MIDFHSHILPGIDDGSRSIEESVKMLEKAKNCGVSAVVATPHFYADHDFPERFLQRRKKAFDALSLAVEGKDLPQIIQGAEVAYFEGISDCENLSSLKIGDSNTILIEMPAIAWNERMIAEVVDIYEKWRLVPIIAHIDRYIKIFAKKDMADWFAGLPVIIQANSSFFEGFRYSRMALRMLADGKIHLIGSDCHNLTTRPPDMDIAIKAIEKKYGKGALMRISETEKSVLQGTNREILQSAYS